jgi:hypothetical protein
MSGIAGLRGTGDWGTDERPKNFRSGILRFNPNGTAPIFALTSKAKKRTVDDPEFAWWCEGNVQIRLQANGAHAAGDTTITVDSADPTSTTLGAMLGTATNLKPGDILLVEPTTDNATFNHELIEVNTVMSDTQFTALRGVGGTTAATIANDQWLFVIGSAYAEGTGAPSAVTRNPIKFSNYTQIFKDTYELSGTANVTNTRTNNDWSEDKRRKAFKHSSDIEASILFGRAAETTGENGKPKRFMGGLRSYIPAANTTVFGAAVTTSTFADAVAPVFDYDTGAGDTRMMFMGNSAAVALSKVFNAATNVRMNSDEMVKVYGLNFMRFQLPMGELLVKIHPLMSRHTLYQKAAFIVDFDALSYVALKNRDTKSKDDVQADDEDVRRGFWMTECSIEVDYGGLTMAYLGNITAP